MTSGFCRDADENCAVVGYNAAPSMLRYTPEECSSQKYELFSRSNVSLELKLPICKNNQFQYGLLFGMYSSMH
jgi:hypothetical protein